MIGKDVVISVHGLHIFYASVRLSDDSGRLNRDHHRREFEKHTQGCFNYKTPNCDVYRQSRSTAFK